MSRCVVFLVLAACVPPPPPLEFTPPPGDDYIPEFAFLSPKETVDLLEGFDWSATTPLPELDPSQQMPRPALFYAWVYVQTPDHVLELDELGVHVSPVRCLRTSGRSSRERRR